MLILVFLLKTEQNIMHVNFTLRQLYFFCIRIGTEGEINPPAYIHNPTHMDGHGLPSELPFEPHTMVISLQNQPERDVFVFPTGLRSLLKVCVLIVSRVLSSPFVAKQPCLPEGLSLSLCT